MNARESTGGLVGDWRNSDSFGGLERPAVLLGFFDLMRPSCTPDTLETFGQPPRRYRPICIIRNPSGASVVRAWRALIYYS